MTYQERYQEVKANAQAGLVTSFKPDEDISLIWLERYYFKPAPGAPPLEEQMKIVQEILSCTTQPVSKGVS